MSIEAAALDIAKRLSSIRGLKVYEYPRTLTAQAKTAVGCLSLESTDPGQASQGGYQKVTFTLMVVVGSTMIGEKLTEEIDVRKLLSDDDNEPKSIYAALRREPQPIGTPYALGFVVERDMPEEKDIVVTTFNGQIEALV